MSKKLTIAPYVLMHYESQMDKYFFYNVGNDNFWETDEITGSIIAALDGTLDCEGIVNLLHKSSPDAPIEDLQEHFGKTFEFLLQEGYILEYTGKKPSYDYKHKEVSFDLDKKSVVINTHKDISDEDYDNYIRYFLDFMFKVSNDIKGINNQSRFSNIYNRMLQHINKSSSAERYLFSSPIITSWNLTQSCNFRCVHCLYNETEYSSKDDLSTEQALNLADELIAAGVITVELSGGETFLRPDIMDIIRRFKENNVGVSLLTNGSLLTDEIINELAELFNPYTDEVRISLDAATVETFKKIRRSDKFNKINENIKKLTNKGVYVVNVCTVMSINKDEIFDIYKLSKSLGAGSFKIGKIDNYNDSHRSLNVEDRELFKIYYELSENNLFDNTYLPGFWRTDQLLNIPEVLKILNEPHYREIIKKIYSQPVLKSDCQCHEKVCIQSDGRIYLCTRALGYDLAPLGSYKENSFAKIWERRWDNPLFQPRDREKSECGSCKYNTWCNGGCKVDAYIKSGSINIPAIPNCRACH